MDVLKYATIYSLAIAVFATAWVGGLAPIAVPVLVFAGIPLLDALLPRADGGPIDRHWLHDFWLWAWVPTQIAAIAATLWIVTHRSGWEGALSVLALGVMTGGGGINIAHELVHRARARDRALAEVLMTSVSYPWWCVEHVLGHHRWVATPRDPATARYGETVYAFLPRSIGGGLASFWGLERDRCARRGIRPWSLRDRRLRYALVLAATYAALYAAGGWIVVAAMAGQSAVAIVLLEVINYVEHYGLRRERTPEGTYERVKPAHSWNSTHWVTGAFLFNLPRHADHHANASRPYWALRAHADAPALPFGYAGMVVVALVPPLWFRSMNPRLISAADPFPAAGSLGQDGSLRS